MLSQLRAANARYDASDFAGAQSILLGVYHQAQARFGSCHYTTKQVKTMYDQVCGAAQAQSDQTVECHGDMSLERAREIIGALSFEQAMALGGIKPAWAA